MRRVWVRKMLPSREIPTALVVGTHRASQPALFPNFRAGDDKQELFSSLSARIASNDALASCTLLSDQLNNLQTSLKALIEGFVREDEESKPEFNLLFHALTRSSRETKRCNGGRIV